MPIIAINLDETPDRLEPVMVGDRIMTIKDIKSEETENGLTHIVELDVNMPDADDHERRTWDRFNFKYAPARVKFKQLVRSAGHDGSGEGVDPSELIGCEVRALVKPRSYKDKDTGETIETTQISKYLFEVAE